jgi:hypothetical protein
VTLFLGLHAPKGTVHLNSVFSTGEISLSPEINTLDQFQKRGQITVSDLTVGNAVYEFDGAQSIDIRSGRFSMKNSLLNAKVKKREGSASHILIQSRETVTLEQDTLMTTDSFSLTDAGHIRIDTQNLTMQDNAMLSSDTQNGGAAGVITLQSEQLTLADKANISSSTSHQGGSSGRIEIMAGRFDMRGETQIKDFYFTQRR